MTRLYDELCDEMDYYPHWTSPVLTTEEIMLSIKCPTELGETVS